MSAQQPQRPTLVDRALAGWTGALATFVEGRAPEPWQALLWRCCVPSRVRTTCNGLFVSVSPQDEIGRRILRTGEYERQVHERVCGLVRPGALVFDIGANLGLFALAAAGRGARCIAFEPSRRVLPLLAWNVAHSATGEKITVVPEAVTGGVGVSPFTEGRSGNWGVGKLASGAGPTATGPSYAVPTGTLDHFAARFGRPDLVKMDIEGGEYLALRDTPEVVRRSEIARLIIEVHPGEIRRLGGSVPELAEVFRAAGYQVDRLGDEEAPGTRQWWVCSSTMA